jgi:hypothetical protein
LGTPTPAILIYGCPAGNYAREDELPERLTYLLSTDAALQAVAAVPTGFVVALTAPGPGPQGSPPADLVRAISLNSSGEITGLTFACPHVTVTQYLGTLGVSNYLIAPR